MKIVYLNPVGILGGAERSLFDLLASLRRAYPAFELILVVGAEGPLVARAETIGVRTIIVPMPAALAEMGASKASQGPKGRRSVINAVTRWGRGLNAVFRTWRYARALREVLRELRPNIIHSNGVKSHLLCRIAAPRGAAVVWHVRDYLGQRERLAGALRWASRRASAAIAISRSIEDDLHLLLPGLSVHVMYDGIDTDYFSPVNPPSLELKTSSPPPTSPASQAGHPLRVGLVATYARWKGHVVFLDAASRVTRQWPELPITFSIVGGAVYLTAGSQFSEQELRNRASALGISSNITFVPFREDVATIYRELDIVVHCSTQPEPFGRTIVEAMSCGRAVIATQNGGAAELFEDGRDAVGVPPRDPDALADAIHRLATDASFRQGLGPVARTSAVRRFGRDRLAAQTRAIYESLR